MSFSLSLSSYLLDASACFHSKHRGTSHIIYNSRILSKLYKAKTNPKKSGLINEKKTQLAQASKKSTVYHEVSTFGTDSCPKTITAYQVVKVRLKWYKIDSNDKW